jgi:Fe-Mn family superoxide dismutase
MFTNGWVWMVTDAHGNLGVLPTFGPSTLLIRSRMNMGTNSLLFREPQGIDPEGPLSPDTATPSNHFSNGPTTPPGVGVTSPTSGMSSRPPGSSGSPLDPQARAYSNGYSNLSMELLSPNSFTGNTFHKDDAAGRKEKSLSAGDCLYPLFCIPTYEHAWMSAGFGVWGKENWLTEFWTVLDWEKVSKLYHDAKNRTTKL